MSRNRLFILVTLFAAVSILSACGASESADTDTTAAADVETGAAESSVSTTTDAGTVEDTAETPEDEPTETTVAAQVESTCDWDSPRLPSTTAAAPQGMVEGELTQAVLGSWQHTHIDSGAGFEAVGPTVDIRYVLTADRFLYCQDVEGATENRGSSARLKLDGTQIVLPSPATGYEVVAVDDTSMVWVNNRDGSLYLLHRR
jgi:hypothetical protein